MISEPKYKLLILEVYKILGAIFALLILLLILSLFIFSVKISLSILGLMFIYIILFLSSFAQNIKNVVLKMLCCYFKLRLNYKFNYWIVEYL